MTYTLKALSYFWLSLFGFQKVKACLEHIGYSVARYSKEEGNWILDGGLVSQSTNKLTKNVNFPNANYLAS